MIPNVPVRAAIPTGTRIGGRIRERPSPSAWLQIAIGMFAAALAVGFRHQLPLAPSQLPTLPLVVTLAIVTTFVGVKCGIATAIAGGILSWLVFFNPFSWSIADGSWIPLLGYAVIATVIVITAHLYRASERLHHERQIAELETRAATSDLFAREMAHRLKNSLAVIQSIAFQTIGSENEAATKFAGRLKTLADANDLLAEHVEKPTADAEEVVRVALHPFEDRAHNLTIEGKGATIPGQQAVMLALAIHELGTNATKYGALSEPSGSVVIRLADLGDRLRLMWQEANGPVVHAPIQAGFGTRLLKRAGIATKLDFDPSGLRCTLDLRTAAGATEAELANGTASIHG